MRLSEVAKLAEPPVNPQAAKLQAQVNRGKKRSKRLAEASGLLGIGALGLRAPQAANALARRSKRLAVTPAIKRLGSMAPHATKLSEASVPLSIGTGALGSFNYAHQVGRENKLNKPVSKSVMDRYRKVSRGAGLKNMQRTVMGHDNKVYGWSFRQGHAHGQQDGAWYAHQHHKGRNPDPQRRWNFDTPDDKKIDDYIETAEQTKRRDQIHNTPNADDVMGAARRLRNRSVATGAATGTALTATGAASIEAERRRQNRVRARQVKKADDRFLRENRDRISPSAEKGYEYLRRGRNTARRQSATSGAVSAGNLLGAGYYLKKKNPMMAGAASLLAVGSGANAVDRGLMAHRWNKQKMGPIKAKALSRKEAGLYAPGRGKQPVDTTSRSKARSDDVAKALWRARVPGIKPSVRPGGLMRLATGRTVTRRGAIPGAGRLF